MIAPVAVLITTPTQELAKSIARTLISQNLIACANILPQITSIYKWEEKVMEDAEVLMIVKTTTEAVDLLAKEVKKIHPYNVPEIIGLKIESGFQDYINWITNSVKV